ncbi:hypothetical protein GF319_10185 [Candidatus Bathyarchaeota archaeon]|nr:hypothetical protein [Candidatus Bathyarchaeota archaeon]
MDASKAKGIDYTTFENLGFNRLIFAKNSVCFDYPMDYKKIELTAEVKTHVDKLFKSIRDGGYYGKKYQKEDSVEYNTDEQSLSVVYTNVPWDSTTFFKEIPFYKDQYEWMIDTIDYYEGLDTERLIIRLHPGETMMNPIEKTYEELCSRYGKEFPDNVTIIKPGDKINSYSLFDNMKLGIVNLSTIGLELAYTEIPTIVVGQAYYKGKGFTIDPKSKEEYKNAIERILVEKDIPNLNRDNLYRLMYSLDKYRKRVEYGGFWKYTGRDEISHATAGQDSIINLKKELDSSPLDSKDFCEILEIILN